MRRAMVVVAALMVLNALIILGTATGTRYAIPLAQGLGFASALAGALWCAVWGIGR